MAERDGNHLDRAHVQPRPFFISSRSPIIGHLHSSSMSLNFCKPHPFPCVSLAGDHVSFLQACNMHSSDPCDNSPGNLMTYHFHLSPNEFPIKKTGVKNPASLHPNMILYPPVTAKIVMSVMSTLKLANVRLPSWRDHSIQKWWVLFL